MSFKKSRRMATIYDGHSHIERRVWMDKEHYGVNEYVRINGEWFNLWELPRDWEIDIWIGD